MANLLEPKEVEIELPDGSMKTYIFSKFPAIAGREIVTQYPLSAMPKMGDYEVNEKIMLKLMCYVAVRLDSGIEQQLTSKALVDNHIRSWETLGKIEVGMIEYNCSFFGNGRASSFLTNIVQTALPMISKMLTGLLASRLHGRVD